MQRQCPNCGGFKTERRTFQINPRTGAQALGCNFAFILPVLLLVLWIVFAWQVSGNPCDSQQCRIVDDPGATRFWVIGMAVAFFGGIVVGILLNIKLNAGLIPAVEAECRLCGYIWVERDDQPPPQITIRPDLIEKGAERLRKEEEEEEERRRRLD